MNAKDISIIVGTCLTGITTLAGAATFVVRIIMKHQKSGFEKEFNAAIKKKDAEIDKLRAEFERQMQRLENEYLDTKKENEYLSKENIFLGNRFEKFPALEIIENAISETNHVGRYLLDELKKTDEQNATSNSKVSELNNKLKSLEHQLIALAKATKEMTASNAAGQWILDEGNRHIWVEDACRAAASKFPENICSTEQLNQLCDEIEKCLVWIGYSLEAYQETIEPPISEVVPQAKSSRVHIFVFNWIKHNKVSEDLPSSQSQEIAAYLEKLVTIFN